METRTSSAKTSSSFRPEMKLKVRKITTQDFQEAFRKLASVAFPKFKENLAVGRAYRQVREAMDTFEISRKAILKIHGKQVGDKIEVSADKRQIVIDALDALLDEETEITLDKVVLPETADLCGRDLFEIAEFLADSTPPQAAPATPTA